MKLSTADVIASKISEAGLGELAGQRPFGVFVAHEPETPQDCITVYDTGGGEADTDELDIEYPTFQVRIRSSNYRRAFARQAEIKNMLLWSNFVADERFYFAFRVTSDITSLGRDERNRFILVASYSVTTQLEE